MGVGPTPAWLREAKARVALGNKALRGVDRNWDRLANDQMRLKYLAHIERCHAEDPVTFAHFEPLVMELITAKLSS